MRTPALRTLGSLAALALVAAACGNGAEPAAEPPSPEPAEEEAVEEPPEEIQPRTLRVATIRTADDPTTLGAEKFAELVAERTDGAVTITVFPDSQLGNFTDLFAGMAGGTIDMFYEGISIYPTLDGAEAFLIMSVPFMWDSFEEVVCVLDTPRVGALLEQAAEATGVRVIAANGDAEPRALSANKPIVTAEDMRGVQLRIAEAPMPQAFATALGANPQVIPFSELWLALRQGVADAQENGAITMVNQSLFEVQEYFMPTNYILDVRSFYISDQVWQSLEPAVQQIMIDAGNEAGEETTRLVREQLDDAVEFLREQINVVEPDIESFRAALEGVFEEFDGDLWPAGLLEEVRELREACAT